MSAPAGKNNGHRAELTAASLDFRARMFEIARAAKIPEVPRTCPKCHGPAFLFRSYVGSVECLCGWTGFLPFVANIDDEAPEPPRTKAEKLRDAGYSRVNGMSETKLKRHMEIARAARRRP